MVRRNRSGRTVRRLLAGTVAALVAIATVAAGPAPALADGHNYVTLTGEGLFEPLTVSAVEHPEHYQALRAEVAWLVDRADESAEPDSDDLGPQYTVVLHVEDEARHRFHLYPLAGGGPRVHRPVEQPAEQEVDEGWFLGRLSMPETLLGLGVPLGGTPAPNGLLGAEDSSDRGESPRTGALSFLDEWREGMILTLGLALAVLAGLASVAFLLRRDR